MLKNSLKLNISGYLHILNSITTSSNVYKFIINNKLVGGLNTLDRQHNKHMTNTAQLIKDRLYTTIS